MEISGKFSQSAQLDKIPKKPVNITGYSLPSQPNVSLISKGMKSGNGIEKTPVVELGECNDDDRDFISTASAMKLRDRYPAEANTHRNMLARYKQGRVIHPDFKDFRNFLLCVGPMPGKGMTLDRIHNNDPEYAPGKVRWADRYTQNNNKSDTLTFHYSRTGDIYTTSRLAKLQKVSAAAIRKRRRDGWTDDEIIEGKRYASQPRNPQAKETTASPTIGLRLPAGLYSRRQLVLLSRSEAQLTRVADIMFHRNAYYHQWHRETHGEEAMLPTYGEFLEIFEEHAAVVTKENHKKKVLKWWEDNYHHVVYSNLKPHQLDMIAEYDPKWVEEQEMLIRSQMTIAPSI